MIRCLNLFRVNVDGLSNGQFSDTRIPCWISCAADAMTSSINRACLVGRWGRRGPRHSLGTVGSRGREPEGQGFGVLVLDATVKPGYNEH